MNFERQDFLRNVVPGYVYILVILSFYLITGGFTDLMREVGKLEPILGLIVTGFPIGVIVQVVYRTWHSCFEHPGLEKTEANMLREQFANCVEILDKIPNIPKIDFVPCFFAKRPDRRLSWFLELFLIEKGNEETRNRSHTLISWVHAYGASMTAIVLAFFHIGIASCLGHSWDTNVGELGAFFVIWLGILTCIFIVRQDTKNIFHVIWRHFVYTNQKELEKFINIQNNVKP